MSATDWRERADAARRGQLRDDREAAVIWRCQCPMQCDDEESCWSDVTQEDFLCDWCREHCRPVAASSGVPVGPEKPE